MHLLSTVYVRALHSDTLYLPSTYSNIYLDTHPNIYPNIYLDTHPNTYSNIYLGTYTNTHPNTYPDTHPNTRPNICYCYYYYCEYSYASIGMGSFYLDVAEAETGIPEENRNVLIHILILIYRQLQRTNNCIVPTARLILASPSPTTPNRLTSFLP